MSTHYKQVEVELDNPKLWELNVGPLYDASYYSEQIAKALSVMHSGHQRSSEGQANAILDALLASLAPLDDGSADDVFDEAPTLLQVPRDGAMLAGVISGSGKFEGVLHNCNEDREIRAVVGTIQSVADDLYSTIPSLFDAARVQHGTVLPLRICRAPQTVNRQLGRATIALLFHPSWSNDRDMRTIALSWDLDATNVSARKISPEGASSNKESSSRTRELLGQLKRTALRFFHIFITRSFRSLGGLERSRFSR